MFVLGFVEEMGQFVNFVDDQHNPIVFVLLMLVLGLFGLDKGKPGFFMILFAIFIEMIYEDVEVLQILSK